MIRLLTLVLLLIPATMPAGFGVAAERVVVICNCTVDAYREAVEGIRETLRRDPIVVTPADAALFKGLGPAASYVYIAVGRDALHAVSARADLAVIGAMLLHEDVAGGAASAGQIELDVPAGVLIQEVRRLFPRKTRIGILAPASVDRAALAARARECGLSPTFVDVPTPAALLKAFRSLRGKVDLVLTLPDAAVYNSATVKPLVMSSLEEGLPLIGFSAGFVRAGAAAGVFADFRDAGRQAAESALRYELGRTPPLVEAPRLLTVAVNQRVLRLLGLDYVPTPTVAVYR